MSLARGLRRGAFGLILLGALLFAPTGRAASAPEESGEVAGLFDVGGGREMYIECRGEGSPTVVLEAGYRNFSSIWSVQGAPGETMVFPGVARFTRVCAYDRPGTILARGEPRSQSDPVPMPRTARDVVLDLHALLGAAQVPAPYVLVGHSFGGLFVRLYASTYPDQVAGLVLVDALSEDVRDLMGPRWKEYDRFGFEERTPGFEDDAELETIDVDGSFDQMRAAATARPLRRMPAVVVSKGLPFDLSPFLATLSSGLPDVLEQAWRAAQEQLAVAVRARRRVIAHESSHYVQVTQPRLVIAAVREIVDAVRRGITVECRGGSGGCTARVNIAGGASNEKVVIRLSDTDLRLVAVRPSSPSLRGAYGLSGQRLRAGGSEYVVVLNAVESIPAGSYLTFRFRAPPPR